EHGLLPIDPQARVPGIPRVRLLAPHPSGVPEEVRVNVAAAGGDCGHGTAARVSAGLARSKLASPRRLSQRPVATLTLGVPAVIGALLRMIVNTMNRRRAHLLFAVSTLALLGAGCGDDIKPGTGGGTGGGTGEADAQPAITDDARLAVVKSVGEGVIFPTYQAFLTKAAALQTAVDAYAATPTADTLAAARAAYVSAMETWQWVEVMQIGVTDTLRGHI